MTADSVLNREVSLFRVVFIERFHCMSVVQYISTCVHIIHILYVLIAFTCIYTYIHVFPCRKRSQISWGPTYSTPKKRPTALLSSMYAQACMHAYLRIHVCTHKLCRTSVIARGNPQSSLTTVHTYVHTCMPRDAPTGLCVFVCTRMHAYTYIRTYVRTYKLLRDKGHVSL